MLEQAYVSDRAYLELNWSKETNENTILMIACAEEISLLHSFFEHTPFQLYEYFSADTLLGSPFLTAQA